MDNRAFTIDQFANNYTKINGNSLISEISSSSSSSSILVNIKRSIAYCQEFYQKNKFDDDNHTKKSWPKNYIKSMNEFYQRQRYKSSFVSFFFEFLPILKWLPKYNLKSDLIPDIITGCTILALNIPQGLAYGHLAGAEPINGLYVSLFPVVIYALFGTSQHISVGTFAVISLACKDVVESFELDEVIFDVKNNTSTQINGLRPIDILVTLCLLVGLIQVFLTMSNVILFYLKIIQFFLGILRLGILSIIISDTLISAFIVASSIHVFTNQIFDFIGIESKNDEDYKISLPMDIVNAYITFFSRLHQTNLATLVLSLVCISLLIACKYILEPYLIRKFKLKFTSLPIDILLVIFVTLISYSFDFNGQFGVRIIPNIPKGFKDIPNTPNTKLMSRMIPNAILICLISYVFTFSLGKMYARKHGYKINPNQELIALGAANMFSSFFLCYPCCASLSRSAVQERVGGRTQIVSFVSAICMIVILFFLSTYLQTLPKCVLSCIITVAIYSTIKPIFEIRTAWKASKLDGVLWIATFFFVIFFGVGHGLLYSLIFSFVILMLNLILPTFKLKYRLDNTEIFLETRYNQFKCNRKNFFFCLSKKDRFIVFEFQGPLTFINALVFRTKFYSMIGCFIVELFEQEQKSHDDHNKHGLVINKMNPNDLHHNMVYRIILDCGRMSYIDGKGVETLIETMSLMKKHGAELVLASCSELVYEKLEKFQFFDNFDRMHCYMSVIDAIMDHTTNDHNHNIDN